MRCYHRYRRGGRRVAGKPPVVLADRRRRHGFTQDGRVVFMFLSCRFLQTPSHSVRPCPALFFPSSIAPAVNNGANLCANLSKIGRRAATLLTAVTIPRDQNKIICSSRTPRRIPSDAAAWLSPPSPSVPPLRRFSGSDFLILWLI